MLGTLQTQQQRVGRGSAQANLAVTLGGIYRFHQRATPLAAGLFAEPELLAAYRAFLARQGKGPHLSMKVLQICWGERDFVFDTDFLEDWIRRFPAAEVYRFPKAGHYVLEDSGDAIIPLVQSFLQKHVKRTALGD